MPLFSSTEIVSSECAAQVGAFRKLYEFHSLRTGAPEDFLQLAPKLASSEGFRLDFSDLARTLRDRERGRLSAAEMLTIVAVGVGGPGVGEEEAELYKAAGTVQVLLAGVGGWREEGVSETAVSGAEVGEAGGHEAGGFGAGLGLEMDEAVVRGLERGRAFAGGGEAGAAGGGAVSPEMKDALARLEMASLQLKVYLDDIDRRMGRIEPNLQELTAMVHSTAERFRRGGRGGGGEGAGAGEIGASEAASGAGMASGRRVRTEEAMAAAMDRAEGERERAGVHGGRWDGEVDGGNGDSGSGVAGAGPRGSGKGGDGADGGVRDGGESGFGRPVRVRVYRAGEWTGGDRRGGGDVARVGEEGLGGRSGEHSGGSLRVGSELGPGVGSGGRELRGAGEGRPIGWERSRRVEVAAAALEAEVADGSVSAVPGGGAGAVSEEVGGGVMEAAVGSAAGDAALRGVGERAGGRRWVAGWGAAAALVFAAAGSAMYVYHPWPLGQGRALAGGDSRAGGSGVGGVAGTAADGGRGAGAGGVEASGTGTGAGISAGDGRGAAPGGGSGQGMARGRGDGRRCWGGAKAGC